VVPAALGDDSVLYGALALARYTEAKCLENWRPSS
jgi:hypothetical protein